MQSVASFHQNSPDEKRILQQKALQNPMHIPRQPSSIHHSELSVAPTTKMFNLAAVPQRRKMSYDQAHLGMISVIFENTAFKLSHQQSPNSHFQELVYCRVPQTSPGAGGSFSQHPQRVSSMSHVHLDPVTVQIRIK